MPGFKTFKKVKVIHTAVIFLFAALIYSGIVGNGFAINFSNQDDAYVILKNPWISSFSNLPAVFKSSLWAFNRAKPQDYYRPFVHLAYMAAYSISGLKPWGYHLLSLLFHAANSALVYLLALMLFEKNSAVPEPQARPGWRNGAGALAAGLVFAAHPIHVEAVAWASSLCEPMTTFFSLMALFVFVNYNGGSGYWKYSLSEAFLLLAALLSKETAAVMPLIFLAYTLFLGKGEKNFSPILKKYAPVFPALAAYAALRISALGGAGIATPHDIWTAQAIKAVRFLALYLAKTILPLHSYGIHPVNPVIDSAFAASVAAALALACFFYFSFRWDKRYFFAGLFFLLPLLLGLYVTIQGGFIGDRYLYISSAGFAFLVGLIFEKFAQGRWEKPVTAAFLCLLFLYGFSTVKRNMVWKNDISLWADAVSSAPDDPALRYDYANALMEKGMLEKSIAQYGRALSLDTSGAARLKICNNLGTALLRKGDAAGAVRVLTNALSSGGNGSIDDLYVHMNLARAYVAINNPQAAIAQYRQVMWQMPNPLLCRQFAEMGYPKACD